jgi:hypothetical protein
MVRICGSICALARMEKLNQSLADGVLTEHYWDDLEGKLVTRTSQDIEPNVEYAKALGNDERYFRDFRGG